MEILEESATMGDIPGLKALRWQSRLESQVGQHSLRIPGATRRMGVAECDRVPRQWNGEAE